MANEVRVWNDNTYTFTQKFRDAEIVIPAKKFVEMDWDDAQLFLGMYFSPVLDGMGQQDPKSYKMLRIEGEPPHLRNKTQIDKIVCAACGDQFASDKDLISHVDRHHLEALADKDLAQKRKAKRAVTNGATE